MQVKIFQEADSICQSEEMEYRINEWLESYDAKVLIHHVTTNSNNSGFWVILFYSLDLDEDEEYDDYTTEEESPINELMK